MNQKGTNEYYDCPARPDLENLTGALELLVEKIDNLVKLNRDIIRWLLIVICTIALGRSALDLGRDFFRYEAGAAHAEVQKQ